MTQAPDVADFVLQRLMERLNTPAEGCDVQWPRAQDGAWVKARQQWWIPAEEKRVDLVIGEPGELLADLDERAPRDASWEGTGGYRFAVPIDEVRLHAPIATTAVSPVADLFERALRERGSARDPAVFALLAADYLRGERATGPQVGRSRDDLGDVLRTAMDDAAYAGSRFEAVDDVLSALPRDVRGAIDLRRPDDADVVNRAAQLAFHRVRPERRALDRFNCVQERALERGPSVER